MRMVGLCPGDLITLVTDTHIDFNVGNAKLKSDDIVCVLRVKRKRGRSGIDVNVLSTLGVGNIHVWHEEIEKRFRA